MTRYDLHPEAYLDLAAIWDFIAEDNPDAADKVIADILAAVDALVPFPYQGHTRIDLTHVRCVSGVCGITSLLMRMKSAPCG
jgi:plasmid stabilization system protein ParE